MAKLAGKEAPAQKEIVNEESKHDDAQVEELTQKVKELTQHI